MEAEIESLKKENEILKQRLSKYTNSPAYRKYYEANKEKINEKKRERAKIDYEKKKLEKIENKNEVRSK
jgi:small-conductance mechanosensitive channel